MGLYDRGYYRDEKQGMGDGMRRVFGSGENPMGWSLPLYTAFGITVRVHIFFIIWMAFRLIGSYLRPDALGLMYTATMMAVLFGIVLLHEYGHCIACRWVGGEADEILLWPLGGLAYCRPPHHWKADLITVIGGPLVNVILIPILAVPLLILGGGTQWVIFNPFTPGVVFGDPAMNSFLKIMLFWAYYLNWILLLFNICLPMFPMDGGRIVQTILWRFVGWRRSMEIATTIGLFGAGCLAVFGLTTNTMLYVMLALFGGFTCWAQKQQLRMMAAGPEFGIGAPNLRLAQQHEQRQLARRRKRQARAQEHEAKNAEELDRILRKIREAGMSSLTRAERKFLEKDTQRRRGE